MTDTNGKETYYVNYDSSDTSTGQVTKFNSSHATDEVTVAWKIVYEGSLDDTSAAALWAGSYSELSTKYVDIAITRTGRVKLGSTAERAVSGSDNTSGIALSFATALPSTITLSSKETAASSETKTFFFGIEGQDGLDTTSTDFGDIVATLSLAATA